MDNWLVLHDERRHDSMKGTIPLVAVVQRNKEKVSPVLDFCELNSYVSLYTVDADVCGEKVREWCRCGQISLIDLDKVYL